jgi:hypothetical protein
MQLPIDSRTAMDLQSGILPNVRAPVRKTMIRATQNQAFNESQTLSIVEAQLRSKNGLNSFTTRVYAEQPAVRIARSTELLGSTTQ